jgi:hypothetical protein
MEKSDIERMVLDMQQQYQMRINELKKEMDDAIASLIRFQKTMFVDGDKQETLFPVTKTIKPPKLKGKGKTIRKRIMTELNKMTSDFGTAQLMERVNNDGGKILTVNGFLRDFAKIRRAGQVIVVQEHSGKMPGIYRKA